MTSCTPVTHFFIVNPEVTPTGSLGEKIPVISRIDSWNYSFIVWLVAKPCIHAALFLNSFTHLNLCTLNYCAIGAANLIDKTDLEN